VADQPIRVLLVVGETAGGIGRHVGSLAAGLPDHGVTVTVCGPASALELLGDPAGVEVREIVVGPRQPLWVAQARRTVRDLATAADVVHAHGLVAGAIAAGSRDTPVVTTWHNAARGSTARRMLHRRLERYVARASSLTLAVSPDLAEHARSAGARSVERVFVPAPVRSAAVPRAKVRAALGAGQRPLVLAVGRLTGQKRFDLLVDAAAGWARRADGPLVAIAGDGDAHQALATRIRSTGAPVTLLGARGDVPDLLAAADLAVVTSEWEGCPLGVQETLRAGVPLVATRVGGIPDLVGEAAVLVDPDDVPALRTALEELLADPARRDELGRAGRAQAATWPSLDDVVARHAEQYRALAAPEGAK
jgi:glycosyltransferase involved in cell wall biosynthesis